MFERIEPAMLIYLAGAIRTSMTAWDGSP